VKRLVAYQRERFPVAGYLPLIAAFTFSAAAYSRLARGEPGFIPLDRFVVGAFTALIFFFMLRVLDEHKDAEVDRLYRPELPVPRGLVSLSELRLLGGGLLLGAALLNLAVEPRLLLAWIPVAAWAALMTREFFVPAWLRARPALYLVSHMIIMPMIDLYTTGLDWLAAGAPPPRALWLFLAVTFLNGVVIEVGRKIRAPDGERPGVDTYTAAWGARRAVHVWLAVTAAAALTAMLALRAVDAHLLALLLPPAAIAVAVPAFRFLGEEDARHARGIETASGIWTLGSYLLIGAGPFLLRALT
jgi:hypothetical protein